MPKSSGGGGNGGRSGGGGGPGDGADLVQEKYKQTVVIMDNLKSGKLSRDDVKSAITELERQENKIWGKYNNVAPIPGKSVISKKDDAELYKIGNKKDVLQSALDYTRKGYIGPGPKHYLSQNMH